MAKKKKEEKPKVHEDLEGFDMKINTFGEITSNFEVDKINEFLNKNLHDKKFTEPNEPLPEDEEE